LWSGFWASRRYARFEKLPAHFGISGKADSYAPRRVMSWLLPIAFSAVLVAIAILMILIPAEFRNGDPLPGVLVAGAGLLGGQVFVLWLTERWVREQPPG
jgi:hypothetical protein